MDSANNTMMNGLTLNGILSLKTNLYHNLQMVKIDYGMLIME
jgi:hypothetical protein